MRFFVFNIAPTLFEIAVVVGLLFYNYGPGFALITLGAVALYVAYSVITTEWRTRFVREQNRADSASNTRAIDSLLNYETVKYFTNERYEADCYDKDLEKWEQARRKSRLSMFALNGGQACIIAATMTAMMALAAYRVSQGTMSIGDFVLINAFMLQIFLPLNFLGFVYREIKGSLASIEHMFALLNEKPDIIDAENASELVAENPTIEFNNVCFSYQQNRDILNGVSFTVNPGEKVAVVGASGAGKSTLVKLLFRFYDPTAGNITINQQDIKSVTSHSLRKAIGIVPQDTVLFNDSIFENIRYGKPEANDGEVLQAITLAHLDTFIEQLPDGHDTLVTAADTGIRRSHLFTGQQVGAIHLKRHP
jgi:ATP-binding cassette subfamily B protein